VTGVSDNGLATATITSPTTVTYDPDAEGDTRECGRTITINYTFSYVIEGVTYTDGTGRLTVDVSNRCNLNRRTFDSPGRFLTVSDDGAATATLNRLISGTDPGQHREVRYTPVDADCGNSVTVSYTYRSGTETRPGSVSFNVQP
jgi:hypothetical protein